MDDYYVENVVCKVVVLELLVGVLCLVGWWLVICVGCIVGQYVKLCFKLYEQVGEQILLVYCGDMVNGCEVYVEQCWVDLQWIFKGYVVVCNIMCYLGWDVVFGQEVNVLLVWISYEMLLFDYELLMLCEDEQCWVYFGLIYWLWIGECICQVDGVYVVLLVEVFNLVVCKVGLEIGCDQLLVFCECFDLCCELGCLMLIVWMGVQKVGECLLLLVEVVCVVGYLVIWLSDLMYGNIIVVFCGNKICLVCSIVEEVVVFCLVVFGFGGVVVGLYLEIILDDVIECVVDFSGLYQVSWYYISFCDLWLNFWQVFSVVMVWFGVEVILSVIFFLEIVV